MIDLDQSNYQDFINEATTLIAHLEEWHEQFADFNGEASAFNCALCSVIEARNWLITATERNAENQDEQRNALLKRIETGTTTARDAILAKRWMS